MITAANRFSDAWRFDFSAHFRVVWTAFYIARGLTVPIKALAEGADEIARGNLAHRVDSFSGRRTRAARFDV